VASACFRSWVGRNYSVSGTLLAMKSPTTCTPGNLSWIIRFIALKWAPVVSNPLTMVDRNGLWSTAIHNEILDEAFPGMPAGDLQTLKNASHDMDYRPGA
jgi:hypothetical protein